MKRLAKTILSVGSAAIVGGSAVASTLSAEPGQTYFTPVIPPFVEVSGKNVTITRDYLMDEPEIQSYLADFYDGDYLITVSMPVSSRYIVDYHNGVTGREDPLKFNGEEKYWVLRFLKFQCNCEDPSTSEDSPYYDFTFFPREAYLENMKGYWQGFTDFRITEPLSFGSNHISMPNHGFESLDCLYSYPDDAFVAYTYRKNGSSPFFYESCDLSYVLSGKFMKHNY